MQNKVYSNCWFLKRTTGDLSYYVRFKVVLFQLTYKNSYDSRDWKNIADGLKFQIFI